jgi:hypothetical protein
MKLIFTIDKIEGGRVTLSDGEGKKIYWPLDKLPARSKEDDKITFAIGEEDDLAKNILNEILGEK